MKNELNLKDIAMHKRYAEKKQYSKIKYNDVINKDSKNLRGGRQIFWIRRTNFKFLIVGKVEM